MVIDFVYLATIDFLGIENILVLLTILPIAVLFFVIWHITN